MSVSDPIVPRPNIVLRNVSKTYKMRVRSKKFPLLYRGSELEALTDVSLIANPGDSIGVLGHNGSGKSTLLNIIAGAETPTDGDVLTSGRPTLLSINAALINYLSGAENIRLGLLAAGMTPQFVKEHFDSIVDFADIGEAIWRPMGSYSSGMDARLRFAIATAVPREILLIDEALSVGDASFENRSQERMNNLLAGSGTVFIVSHSAGTIEKNCNKAIWVHAGKIIAEGEAHPVAVQYRNWVLAKQANDFDKAEKILNEAIDSYQAPSIVLTSEIDLALQDISSVR